MIFVFFHPIFVDLLFLLIISKGSTVSRNWLVTEAPITRFNRLCFTVNHAQYQVIAPLPPHARYNESKYP